MRMRKHHPRPDRGAGWTVTESDGGFTVWHEGEAWAVFLDRSRALLTAAILPHLEAGFAYRLRRDPTGAPGFDVTTRRSQSVDSETVGWLREYNPEMAEALHVLERVVESPTSLDLLLQAVRSEEP